MISSKPHRNVDDDGKRKCKVTDYQPTYGSVQLSMICIVAAFICSSVTL